MICCLLHFLVSLLLKTFKYSAFRPFDYEHTWRRLFQKHTLDSIHDEGYSKNTPWTAYMTKVIPKTPWTAYMMPSYKSLTMVHVFLKITYNYLFYIHSNSSWSTRLNICFFYPLYDMSFFDLRFLLAPLGSCTIVMDL
jgi:hypothetical protein